MLHKIKHQASIDQQAKRSFKPESGFTILEILMAMVLLGVLLIVVLSPMTGLFKMSRGTNNNVSSTMKSQNIMEQIKGVWASQSLYDRDCLPNLNTTGSTVIVTNLNDDLSLGAVVPYSADPNCSTLTPDNPVITMKRIQIDTGTASLVLDLQRPTQ